MAFTIVITTKGLIGLPQKLRRFRLGIIARVSRMLELIGQEIASRSVEDYLSGPRPKKLGRRSGDLARSVNYKLSGNRVIIGTNLIYGRVHEGIDRMRTTIVPKKSPILRFRLPDGSWRSAHEVTINARPFLRPALTDSVPAAKSIIKRLADQALKEALA